MFVQFSHYAASRIVCVCVCSATSLTRVSATLPNLGNMYFYSLLHFATQCAMTGILGTLSYIATLLYILFVVFSLSLSSIHLFLSLTPSPFPSVCRQVWLRRLNRSKTFRKLKTSSEQQISGRPCHLSDRRMACMRAWHRVSPVAAASHSIGLINLWSYLKFTEFFGVTKYNIYHLRHLFGFHDGWCEDLHASCICSIGKQYNKMDFLINRFLSTKLLFKFWSPISVKSDIRMRSTGT